MFAGLVTETLVYHSSDLMYNVGKGFGADAVQVCQTADVGKINSKSGIHDWRNLTNLWVV